MKKLLSLALVILMLIPSFALAEVEGVTVSQFVDFFKENYPAFVATETAEYKDRQLVLVAIGSAATVSSAAMGYTYKNSDVIEFLTTPGADDTFTTYFLAAMSDADTAAKRIADAQTYITTAIADAMSYFSNKWSKNTHLGHYYLELNSSSDGSADIVWIWLHEDSKQKNKSAASSLIGAEEYPLLSIAMQLLAAPTETAAPATDDSDGITLSSGEWECPAHIAAGEYVVTPQKTASIFVRRGDDLIVGEYLTTSDNDEIGRLVLQDGDRLEISGGKLLFTPFQ